MIKLSIVVPVYNVEKYLKKCLDSLVSQTLKDIEIIVVNDGSKDDSQIIIDDYKKKYSKIIKSFIKENGGLSDARNFGIAKAKGEYIAFLDSDDYVKKDAYEKMYLKAKEKNFDMVVCDFVYAYNDHNDLAYSNVKKDIFDRNMIKNLYSNIYPAAWNKIYRRKVLIDNQILFKKGVWFEDVEFIYRLLPFISNVGVVNEDLIYYVQRDSSITKTYDKRLYDHVNNWDGILDFYRNRQLYNDYKKELEYAYVRYVYATFIKQCTNYKEKKEYDDAVNYAIIKRREFFPKYRKNSLFYKNGLKGIYLLLFNRFIAKLYYRLKK